MAALSTRRCTGEGVSQWQKWEQLEPTRILWAQKSIHDDDKEFSVETWKESYNGKQRCKALQGTVEGKWADGWTGTGGRT